MEGMQCAPVQEWAKINDGVLAGGQSASWALGSGRAAERSLAEGGGVAPAFHFWLLPASALLGFCSFCFWFSLFPLFVELYFLFLIQWYTILVRIQEKNLFTDALKLDRVCCSHGCFRYTFINKCFPRTKRFTTQPKILHIGFLFAKTL
jgi:hypothetical protein